MRLAGKAPERRRVDRPVEIALMGKANGVRVLVLGPLPRTETTGRPVAQRCGIERLTFLSGAADGRDTGQRLAGGTAVWQDDVCKPLARPVQPAG